MRHPRSYLFVPGDRAERLERAHSRGADAVIADLEDAVAPADKDAALANVERWLVETPAQAWVRLNTGDQGVDELRRLASFPRLRGVLAPKAETVDDVVALCEAAQRANGSQVLVAPMVESATGLMNVRGIAAVPGVFQLHIGELDLAADLGVTPSSGSPELAYARSRVVVASRSADIAAPAAPVSPLIGDEDSYRTDTEALARMGFVGRACIHPSQVAIANDVFTPTTEDLAWARRVLDQAVTQPGAWRDVDGNMLDEAVLRRARRVLALAGG